MVKTMTQSGEIPQFGYSDEINMDALVRWALIQYWAYKSLFTKTTFVNFYSSKPVHRQATS